MRRNQLVALSSLRDAKVKRLRLCSERKYMENVIPVNDLDILSFVVDPAELGGDQKPGFNCPNCNARSRVFERMDPVRAVHDDSYCHAAIASLEDLAQIQATGGHCDKTAVGNVIGQSERGWPIFEKKSNQIIPLLLRLKETGFFESEFLNRKPTPVCFDYATILGQKNLSLNLQQLTGIWVLTFSFAFMGLLVKCIYPCYDRRKLKSRQSVSGFDQLGQEINFVEDQNAKWLSARGIVDQKTGRKYVSEEIAEEVMMNISGRHSNKNILSLINAATKRRGIETIADRPYITDDLAGQIAIGLAERHINQNVISFSEILKNRCKEAKETAAFQSVEPKKDMNIVSNVLVGNGTNLTTGSNLHTTIKPRHFPAVILENEVENEFQPVFTQVNTDFVKAIPRPCARKRSSIDTDSQTVPLDQNENVDSSGDYSLKVHGRRSCSESGKRDTRESTAIISERSLQTQLDPPELSCDIKTTLSRSGKHEFISEMNSIIHQKKKPNKKKAKGKSHTSLTNQRKSRKKTKRLPDISMPSTCEFSEKPETPVQFQILQKNVIAMSLCEELEPLPLRCVFHEIAPKLIKLTVSVDDEIPMQKPTKF